MVKKIYLSVGFIFVEETGQDLKTFNIHTNDLSISGDQLILIDKITGDNVSLGNYDEILKKDDTVPTSLMDAIVYISSLFSVATSTDVNPNQIPPSYNSQSSNGVVKRINVGQLNKLRIRPSIINEHVESSREIQGIVDATTIVGQIFKASRDNINGINLTLESSEGQSIDNFESYADSNALQQVWVASNVVASLETTIVDEGTKSMKLPLTNNLDEWVNTMEATDYTNYDGSFSFYQEVPFGLTGAEVYVFIGDGTNTKSSPINVSAANEWNHIEINEAAMVEDQAGITDVSLITKIGFRVIRKRTSFSAYVDNLVATPPPGSIGLKLWDMGSEIPETGVTTLDDGTQYEQLGDRGVNGGTVVAEVILPMLGGKRLYAIKDFAAGVALEIPDNSILTPDNYYAITLNYIDTDVSVFGPDSSFEKQYYINGFGFIAADESTPIVEIGEYNDLMFAVYSTQHVYVNTLFKVYNDQPGVLATESVFIEDKDMKITSVVSGEFIPTQQLIVEFKDRVFEMDKGSKFEIYYNSDYTDNVVVGSLLIGYIFEPLPVNG